MGTAGNTDFAAVSAVCSLLSRLTVPYWIIGGWAIDLAVGRVTRDHADVDVMLLERDKRALWDDLPEDEVQITGRDRESRRLTLHRENLLLPTEVFLAEADGTFWVHRRGAYSVKRPTSRHNPPSGRDPLPRPRGGTAVQGALESGQGPARRRNRAAGPRRRTALMAPRDSQAPATGTNGSCAAPMSRHPQLTRRTLAPARMACGISAT